MSLVICSNKAKDDPQRDNSVNDAFNFRNELSSTMKIPANAQVALQSCKVNVDGSLVVDRNNTLFYHYFGELLDRDGETAPQIENVTSYPVPITITDGNEVLELSKLDFANQLQARMELATFHPNQKTKVTVEEEANPSEGFTITFNSNNASTNNRPSSMVNFGDSIGDAGFTFSSHVFTRTAADDEGLCSGIATQYPMSNISTSRFTVNISGTGAGTGNANASGVPWAVGLSRFASDVVATNDMYAPNYFAGNSAQDYHVDSLGFADFAICRNGYNELVLLHAIWNNDYDGLSMEEVRYWENTNSSFNGADRVSLDGVPYSKAEFRLDGERMGAWLYNSSTASYELITEYDAAQSADSYFKPVNQACWSLHPVLSVDFDRANLTDLSSTLAIEHFNGLEITGYDVTKVGKSGWFENQELKGQTEYCSELEQRGWNTKQDLVTTNYAHKATNASGTGIDYNHVLILTESNVYTPTPGANAKLTLGHNHSVVEASSIVGSKETFNSDTTPTTSNIQALFVRLHNFGQKTTNAVQKNKSNIIAHLPRFDNGTSIGRLHFEPNNLMYLDLENPYPLNVNEFQISFCYANEQYARTLVGQSVVCLHFRERPKI